MIETVASQVPAWVGPAVVACIAVGTLCTWASLWCTWKAGGPVPDMPRPIPVPSPRVAHPHCAIVPHEERARRKAWREDIESLREDICVMPHGRKRCAMVRSLEQLEATYGYAD